jgi:hypothetical protein
MRPGRDRRDSPWSPSPTLPDPAAPFAFRSRLLPVRVVPLVVAGILLVPARVRLMLVGGVLGVRAHPMPPPARLPLELTRPPRAELLDVGPETWIARAPFAATLTQEETFSIPHLPPPAGSRPPPGGESYRNRGSRRERRWKKTWLLAWEEEGTVRRPHRDPRFTGSSQRWLRSPPRKPVGSSRPRSGGVAQISAARWLEAGRP